MRRRSERVRLWPSITLVGPDGAGKSALVRALKGTAPVARHEHFRPFHAASSDGINASPQDQAAYPASRGFLKLVFLFAEQLLAEIPRRRDRRTGLLLQERGWWDQLIDPRRYRLPNSSRKMVLILGRCLPRPAFIVLVTAPVAVIRTRKQELEPGEIHRQIECWRRQGARAKHGLIEYDTSSASPELIAEQVWAYVSKSVS